MTGSLEDALAVVPEGNRLYKTDPVFKAAIDQLDACFEQAHEELSDEDYSKFLKYALHIWKETAPVIDH